MVDLTLYFHELLKIHNDVYAVQFQNYILGADIQYLYSQKKFLFTLIGII